MENENIEHDLLSSDERENGESVIPDHDNVVNDDFNLSSIPEPTEGTSTGEESFDFSEENDKKDSFVNESQCALEPSFDLPDGVEISRLGEGNSFEEQEDKLETFNDTEEKYTD